MDLTGKTVHYTQEGKSIFDQFHVDEDYNVPDRKPDVKKVIYSSAIVKTEEIRPVENYIRMAGKVWFRILYLTASPDPGPEILEGRIPFEEMVYAETEEGETFYIRNIRTEFQVSAVNSRKLGMRISVEAEIGREKTGDRELTVDVGSPVTVYKKMQKIRPLELVVSRNDTYRIREELTLPGTKESVGQLLFTDVENRRLDIRPGHDELLIRGELQIFCMYLSAEDKADWIGQSIPYEGRVPCTGAEEGMFYHVRHTLEDPAVDVRPDEDGEMRVLGIEATLALKMNIFGEEETEILEDIYSLEQECVPEIRESVYEELLMQNQSKCKVSERLALPELKDDVLQILHSSGDIQLESELHDSSGIHLEGILHLSFLYLRADDQEPYGNWHGIVPFSYLIDYPDLPENVLSSLTCHVEQLTVSLAGSEAVEVKAVLAFDTFLRQVNPVKIITDVRMEPFDPDILALQPGIAGHIVQPGEDLWGLAKKYLTTTEGIMEINGMESDRVRTGDKLLIFKENMSIL